jgi:hypothetical protein
MKTLSNSIDDNEFARYLASYLVDNLDVDWPWHEISAEERVYKVLLEFYETLK